MSILAVIGFFNTYIEKIDYEPPELLNEGEYIKDDSIRSGKIKDFSKRNK